MHKPVRLSIHIVGFTTYICLALVVYFLFLKDTSYDPILTAILYDGVLIIGFMITSVGLPLLTRSFDFKQFRKDIPFFLFSVVMQTALIISPIMTDIIGISFYAIIFGMIFIGVIVTIIVLLKNDAVLHDEDL